MYCVITTKPTIGEKSKYREEPNGIQENRQTLKHRKLVVKGEGREGGSGWFEDYWYQDDR